MIELWQYIFSSFWIWLGTVILVCCVGSMCIGTIAAIRGER